MRNDENYTQFDDDAIPIKRRSKSSAKISASPEIPIRNRRVAPSASNSARSVDRSVYRQQARPAEQRVERNTVRPAARPAPRTSRVSASPAQQNRTVKQPAQQNALYRERPQTARPVRAPGERISSGTGSAPSGAQRTAPQTTRRTYSAPPIRSTNVKRENAEISYSGIYRSGIPDKTRKKKNSLFKKAFLIYIGVLAVLFVLALIYVHGLLVDFEATQSDNVVAEKLSKVKAAASAGKIESEMSLENLKEKYSPTEEELNDYQKAFATGTLTYKKSQSGLSDDKVEYDVFLNGFWIGDVKLKCVGQDTILAIFPITDWEIEGCNAEIFSFDFPSSVTVKTGDKVIEGKTSSKDGLYSYTVASLFSTDTTITDSVGNTASFNGKERITFSTFTVKTLSCYDVYYGDTKIDASAATNETIDVYKYIEEYCADAPKLSTYNLCLIGEGDKISVKDRNGADVETKQDGTNYEATKLVPTAQMPAGLAGDPDPITIAETWSLFMSQDLTGPNNGFAQLAKYLITDSYFYNSIWEYATGIDITFTSDHTLDNPAFTFAEASDFVKFSDTCFSCHIKLDKPMNLSNGTRIVDSMDSTFYFVYYDDTDDGADNPHWALVDRQ